MHCAERVYLSIMACVYSFSEIDSLSNSSPQEVQSGVDWISSSELDMDRWCFIFLCLWGLGGILSLLLSVLTNEMRVSSVLIDQEDGKTISVVL